MGRDQAVGEAEEEHVGPGGETTTIVIIIIIIY